MMSQTRRGWLSESLSCASSVLSEQSSVALMAVMAAFLIVENNIFKL